MADNKLGPRDRKSSYISPLIIGVVVLALGGIAFFRLPEPETPKPVARIETPAQPVPAAQPPPAAPVMPAAQPSLTREDMIFDARQAASEFAVSGTLSNGSAFLVGRRFSISIPFGCRVLQNSASASQLSATYNVENQTITLTARPGVWTTLPLIQGLPDAAKLDAVEGFWIPRSWTSADSCPPQIAYPAPAMPTPPTAQTVGLAQLFTAGGSRISRHAERPYEFTRKIATGDTGALAGTYRLVLEGRVTGFDKNNALRCWMETPDHQPVCIYAVTLDRVAFLEGETGKQIATWTD